MSDGISRLVGRTALVTGSSSGIGLAIAESFASAGAGLVLHGRDDDPVLRDAVSRCRALGADVHGLAADLSDAELDACGFVSEALALAPEIDVFVSCAGAFFDLPFLEMTADRLDHTWRLNVRSGYLLAIEVARHWQRCRVAGRMIFVGSINGQQSESGSTAYDISKTAVHGMVRALCVELAPMGIRVNGLAPGLIRTPATRWLDEEPARADWAALHTPSGRVPGPDVCGEPAVFLAGDGAEHVHGHVLNVDGGLAALQFPAPPG